MLNTFLSHIDTEAKIVSKRLLRHSPSPVLRSSSIVDGILWMEFSNGEEVQNITIPIPEVQKNGNYIITTQSGVQRAVGTWLIEDVEYNYWQLLAWLFTQRVEQYVPTSSKRAYLSRLLVSFNYDQAPLVFRNFQKIIDGFINKLPLIGTDMQAWAMCNRVQVLDPNWDTFTPQEALAYQRDLNLKKFPWTSLGQSDSGMCNNTLLKADVRKTIPFGLSHHNPRRNLFQTLGMKGDETPSVMSVTEKELANKGIVRGGWNWMTAFVDLPENFEDQIIVSERLFNLFMEERRKFICHGKVMVEVDDETSFLHPISIEPDGSIVRFHLRTDSAIVESIDDTQINFNGAKKDVKSVTIKYRRVFKDGFKITNRSGNKGIVMVTDTGVVHDPVRGDIPIDVIVSAKSVMKRKNFGQLLEALTTLLHGKDREIVVEDDITSHTDKVKEALKDKGYNDDGTCRITTRWGSFSAVSGWVHWGAIKTPEDQVWNKFDTRNTNNRELRVAGNKFSLIESKALITTFGPNNPVLSEIEYYRQGHDIVFDAVKVLGTMRGDLPNLPVMPWEAIKYIDQKSGFFHDLVDFGGTVADTSIFHSAFYIMLPAEYRYVIRRSGNIEFSEDFVHVSELQNTNGCVVLDRILIPPAKLRKPWKHQSGKYGLSDIAALINIIIGAIHKHNSGEAKAEQIGRAIYLYFHGLSKMLSTKTGVISSLCMSVRYPWTVKGTAAIGENLESNNVEIHTSMAKDLKVKTGDFVLVERFPCLGFMSLRVQKVKVTHDPECRYIIRVSGNSLSSQALDFDGDVLYLMSFHSLDSKEALEKEFYQPHPARLEAYKAAADKKIPATKELTLDDYKMEIFPSIDAETNADIVAGLTGIKRGTGTIIALCYNILRIMEKNIGFRDIDMSIAIERLLDKVANSVFSMKHAGKSLEAECREAICTADVEKMIALDLDPVASAALAEIVIKKAEELGFSRHYLKEYFYKSEKEGRSSIINLIIRKDHKIWLTSRSNLHPVNILENLDSAPGDLAGWMFQYSKKKWESETSLNERQAAC